MKTSIGSVFVLLALLGIACNFSGSNEQTPESARESSETDVPAEDAPIDATEIFATPEAEKVETPATAATPETGAVQTPPKSSPERTAILDTLRQPVERELKQKIQFYVENLKVAGDWAFVGGRPQTKAGKTPDYRGTRYGEAVAEGAFDNNIFALLKKTGGRWKIVVYYIGCTDVCYSTWWKDHGAPKAIFPYTE
jgi:hypothetical protein